MLSLRIGKKIAPFLIGLFALLPMVAMADGMAAHKAHNNNIHISAKREKTMTTEELKQAGSKLRKAIEDKYKELVDTKQLKGREIDITDVVKPYIYVGMPFEMAEKIMGSAGLQVSPRPKSEWIEKNSNNPYKYDVLAQRKMEESFGFSVTAGIDIAPKNPADYRTVGKVFASYVISSL